MIKIKLAKEQPIETYTYWSYPVEEIDHILENAEDGDVYLYFQGRLYEATYLNEDKQQTENDAGEKYIRSSTNGDYSPSTPWDAPGMSVSDFI